MKLKGTGRLMGVLLLTGGIIAVVFIRREPADVIEIVEARPLKTMVIGEQAATLITEFPGKVAAGEQVDMAFEFGGTLTELPVKEGDRVKKGQVLARLDARDAQNQLDAATAELQRAKAQLDRMQIAAEAKAVSLQEVSNAEATYNIALAQKNIKEKALDDTDLKASFDGIIARVPVKNFQTVQPKQTILSLQDLTDVEISASIPESFVAQLRPPRGEERITPRFTFRVVFDFLPDREFELQFKEFTVEADALTQAFTAKFAMPSPQDVSILPGMACSVKLKPIGNVTPVETAGFEVPLDAVPIDGVGQYYVWLVTETPESGLYQAKRQNVEVGQMTAQSILIKNGLKKGDRIALAGVHVLLEGTTVRLLDNKGPSAP